MRRFCTALLVLLCSSTIAKPRQCGTERWPVKVGSDPGAGHVVLRETPTTVHDLVALRNPPRAKLPQASRVTPAETTLWTLQNVTLSFVKREADSDYHLVIGDGADTMIAEIPAPSCVPLGSPFLASITRARAALEGELGKRAGARRVHEVVTLMGIGFFDFIHGQKGVAKNGIEIHPVLAICFGQDCTWK